MKRLAMILLLLTCCCRAQQVDNPLEEMLFVEQDQQYEAFRREEDKFAQSELRMPNVEGMTQGRAMAAVQALDYSLVPIIKNAPSEGIPGRVVSQTPSAGQPLDGATVVLFVSTELISEHKRNAVVSARKDAPLTTRTGKLGSLLVFLLAQAGLLVGWFAMSVNIDGTLDKERRGEVAMFQGRSNRRPPAKEKTETGPLKLT